MSDINLSNSPYYDDYDPSKGYTRMLALPGRVEQSREFTQVQGMFLDFLKRFGDSFLHDGSIIEGCDFIPISNTSITISAGRIYMDGIVHNVDESHINITGIGSETIGAVLTTTVVTEVEDPTLLDPAEGYRNYNQPGTHRLKKSVSIVANTVGSAVLYRLTDGELFINSDKPQIDTVTDTLAKRTYDESGNYKVSGFDIINKGIYNDTTVTVNVDKGKAYVLGYSVDKPTATAVVLDKALTIRSVVSEPITYATGTALYPLGNVPVKQITRLVATISTTATITRGSTVNGTDALPNTPVADITSVVQGGTTYVKTTSYLVTSTGISWSPGGPEPSIGTSYNVSWTYTKVLTYGVDYTLSTDGTQWYAEFLSGLKPVNSTIFYVDYDFYLARKDLLCLDKDGNIVVVQGQPEIDRLLATPTINNDTMLKLGTVYLPPNGNTPIPITYAITRMSMEKIFSLLTRIEDLEYNNALTSLDTEAISGESSTTLKGVLTDAFVGLSKVDTTHPLFACSLDFDYNHLCLPFTSQTTVPQINPTGSVYKATKRAYMAQYTETVSINQGYATEVMLVNPYAVYNKSGYLTITPSSDNWIDETTVIIDGGTVTNTFAFRRWWYHQGESWADEERRRFIALGFADGGASLGWGSGTVANNDVTSDKVIDEAILYIRQRTVSIEADNFIANSDNIQCTFDGIQVSLTPYSGTYQGTAAGTLKADSTGKVKGSFTIPSRVACGVREVKLYNAQNVCSDVYTAMGRKRTIERTVTHQKTTVTPVDPLAQSFGFTDTSLVTSVGLYFASKDPTIPVTVQIRDMSSGYPGTTVYAEKVVYPSSITVSANASQETKVTFDDPVICEPTNQYCVAILTDSPVYSMFVANLADKDIKTGQYVSKQPYNTGVLFSSSNALTWTAHQTKDLTFKVYTASFTTDGTIYFNALTGISYDRVMIAADYITPGNTSAVWEYRINGASWLPFVPYHDIYLTTVATSLEVRVTLQASSDCSAMMSLDSLYIVGFTNALSGNYVTKNVAMSQPFTIVKQVAELYVPAGATIEIYYATDTTGTTWVKQINPTVTAIANSNFVRYEYSATVSSSTNFRARIRLVSPSQTVEPRVRRFMNIIK